jgi:hypothetical protein
LAFWPYGHEGDEIALVGDIKRIEAETLARRHDCDPVSPDVTAQDWTT